MVFYGNDGIHPLGEVVKFAKALFIRVHQWLKSGI